MKVPESSDLTREDALAPLRPLAGWLPRLEQGDFDLGIWAGGEKQPDGAITMPYFSYSDEGLRFIATLPVVVFDWMAWMATDEARSLIEDHGQIASATPEQLIKLTTAIKRGDRFTEGNVAGAHESGVLVAIARRAVELGA